MNPLVAPAPTSRPFNPYTGAYAGQAAVIGEMLASLDTLTNAGRHHVMAKIVGFFQGRVGATHVADPARAAEMLERLQREAARPLPVVASFTQEVERLLALPGLVV
jgi:hypothetical protein